MNIYLIFTALVFSVVPVIAQPERKEPTVISQQLLCEVIENNLGKPQGGKDRSNLVKRVHLKVDQLDWVKEGKRIQEHGTYGYKYMIPNYFADPEKHESPVIIKFKAIRKTQDQLHLQMTEIALGGLKSDTFYATSAPTSRLEVSARRYGSDRIAVKCELTEIN